MTPMRSSTTPMEASMADKPDRSLVLAHSAKEQADAVFADSAKALRAYELRSAGTPWWDIAEELGVTERYAASLVANKIASAARMVDEGVKQHLLAMEVERLDQLQRSVWDRALGGDLRAVDAVLRIITTRAKILGLENATASTVTNNTIVVAGNTDEYIAALQRATHQEVIDGD